MKPEAVFRIHFEDGRKITLSDTNAAAARREALAMHEGIVRKIKLIREKK